MAQVNLAYSRLDDVTVDNNSGFTNHFLTAHNDLFPVGPTKTSQCAPAPVGADKCNIGREEYGKYVEAKPNEGFVYSNIKDLECTPLMAEFMSRRNLDFLQQMIIDLVAKRGGYTIGRQSDDELLIIMRSTYYQYSRNFPTDISGQVRELNRQVLLYAVPNVLSRVQGYLGYVYEQRTPNEFLSYPPLVSQKTRATFTGDFSSLMI